MGTKTRVLELLLKVARANVPDDIDGKEMLNRIDPKPAVCGFTRLRLALICPCGATLGLDMTPEPMTEADVELAKLTQPELTVIDNRPEGSEQKNPTVATSHGDTDHECPQCNTPFILAWEVHGIRVKKGLKLPWEDPEIPEPPSSRQSMTTVNGNGTVH